MRALLMLALTAGTLTVGLMGEAAAQNYPLPRQPPINRSPPLIRPLQFMSPFPVVRIVGRLTRQGARIRVLSVRAPANATIFVRCFRRRCRSRSRKSGGGFERAVRFSRFERSLRTGTIIEVSVGRSDVIGKFTRFRIRHGRRPARRDLCLRPGESNGTVCPDR